MTRILIVAAVALATVVAYWLAPPTIGGVASPSAVVVEAATIATPSTSRALERAADSVVAGLPPEHTAMADPPKPSVPRASSRHARRVAKALRALAQDVPPDAAENSPTDEQRRAFVDAARAALADGGLQ